MLHGKPRLNRSQLAGLLVAFFLITQIIDIVLTCTYSPDLGREANVLVRHAGFGWREIIVGHAMGSCLIIWMTVIWSRGPLGRADHETDFWAFASVSYHAQRQAPAKFLLLHLFAMPKVKRDMVHLLGFVTPCVIGCTSLMSSMNWLLLYGGDFPRFRHFFATVAPWYPYVIPVALFYFASMLMYFSYEWSSAKCRRAGLFA